MFDQAAGSPVHPSQRDSQRDSQREKEEEDREGEGERAVFFDLTGGTSSTGTRFGMDTETREVIATEDDSVRIDLSKVNVRSTQQLGFSSFDEYLSLINPTTVRDSDPTMIPTEDQSSNSTSNSNNSNTLFEHTTAYLQQCCERVALLFAPLTEGGTDAFFFPLSAGSEAASSALAKALLERMAAHIASLQYEASKEEVNTLIDEEARKSTTRGGREDVGMDQRGEEKKDGEIRDNTGNSNSGTSVTSGGSGLNVSLQLGGHVSSRLGLGVEDEDRQDRRERDERDESALDKQEMNVRSRRLRRRLFKSSLLVMVQALFGTLDTANDGSINLEDSLSAEHQQDTTEDLDRGLSAHTIGSSSNSNSSSSQQTSALQSPSPASTAEFSASVLVDLLEDLIGKSSDRFRSTDYGTGGMGDIDSTNSTDSTDGSLSSSLSDLHSATFASHTVKSAVEADFPAVLEELSVALALPKHAVLFQVGIILVVISLLPIISILS